MPTNFLSLTLPLPGTYSARSNPCHYDHPAPVAVVNKPVGLACPFKSYCRKSGHRLDRLERVYGRSLVVTLSETTASIMNRADQHFRGGEISRHSLRKHLYVTAGIEAPASLLLCQETLDAVEADKRWSETAAPLMAEFRDLVSQAANNEVRVASINDLKEMVSATAVGLLQSPLTDVIRRQCRDAFTCRPFASHERLRSYVGFVDNRLASPVQPIEMALLAPPTKYTNDPTAKVITGAYARLFGQTDFQSTFFSMCEGEQGGASCAETCVTMALGVLSDQVPVLQGGFDLAFLASRVRPHPIAEGPAPDGDTCLHRAPGLQRSFVIDGLPPRDIDILLNEELQGTYGTSFTEGAGYVRGVDDHVLMRIIESHIDARIPLILHVDAGQIKAHHLGLPVPDESSPAGHAVVVVGYRGDRKDPGRFSLIFHDPSFGPYQEIPLATALVAARAVRRRESKLSTGLVRWNACSAKWLSIHPLEALDWVMRRQPASLSSLDFRVSLCSTNDLLQQGLIPSWVREGPRAGSTAARDVQAAFRKVAKTPHCWSVYVFDRATDEFLAGYFFLFDDAWTLYDAVVYGLVRLPPNGFRVSVFQRSRREVVLYLK